MNDVVKIPSGQVVVRRDVTTQTINTPAGGVRVQMRNTPQRVTVRELTAERIAPDHVTVKQIVQGPQGPPGASGGLTDIRTADGILGGHRVVRSVDALRVGYADATNAAHGDDTIGMTTGAALDGATVEVQRTGTLTFNGWSWTAGEPVYLTGNGLLTQTPPDDSHAFLQVVGHAESPTSVFINIEPPIYY